MGKSGRLLGTLLALSIVFVACKKDDYYGGKKGGKDSSFNDGFSNSKKKSQSSHYSCSANDNDHGNGNNNNGNHHGKKITICHNGQMITISINAVLKHFKQHGTDLLFSCDAATGGVAYADVANTLNKIIHDRHLQGNQARVIQRAFNIWYRDYYLAGNWPLPVDNGGGGTGGGDPGDTIVEEPVDTTPVVTIPMMDVCHDGQLMNVTCPVAYSYFENGDILFSCDPSLGVYFSDVEGPLLDIIYDYTLDPNASDVMFQAFMIWHADYYLAGNWPPEDGGAGGGSGGGGEGNTGTGSDTTVVIHN